MDWHLKFPSGNATCLHISFAKASHVATLQVSGELQASYIFGRRELESFLVVTT